MTLVLNWTCDGSCGLWVFKGFGWNIKVVSIIIWAFVRHTVSRCLTFPALQELTWSRGQVLANRRQPSFPPVLPLGQYGLWFGFWFSGPLRLHSHYGQVTFREHFPGVPSCLGYTQKLARSTLALKLTVTTKFLLGDHHMHNKLFHDEQTLTVRGQPMWCNVNLPKHFPTFID